MLWHRSHRADQEVRPLADEHYSRQSVGATQFVASGSCLVLKLLPVHAYWVTLWQKAEHTDHAWPGAFNCAAFRNEGSGHLSSDLITQAVAATRWHYGCVPQQGMITMVDADKIKSPNPGYCFKCAGFVCVGRTKSGKDVLKLYPERFPEPEPPCGAQLDIGDILGTIDTNKPHNQALHPTAYGFGRSSLRLRQRVS